MNSCAKWSTIWLAALSVSATGCESLCVNTIEAEVVSPSRSYRAVVFRRDCGATTSESTQVALVGATDSLTNTAGNVLALRNAAKVEVEWSRDTLVILLPRAAPIDYQVEEVLGTAVRYVAPTSEAQSSL